MIIEPKPSLCLLKPEVAEIELSMVNEAEKKAIELAVKLRWFERQRIRISPEAAIDLIRQDGTNCPLAAIEAACYSAASFALRKIGYGRCYVEVTRVVGNVGDFDLMVLAAMMSLSVFLLTGHQEIYEQHLTQDLLAGWRVRSCELSNSFPPYLPQFERRDIRQKRGPIDVAALTRLLMANAHVPHAEALASGLTGDLVSTKMGILIQKEIVSEWFGLQDPSSNWGGTEELMLKIEKASAELVLTFTLDVGSDSYTSLSDPGYNTLYGILVCRTS